MSNKEYVVVERRIGVTAVLLIVILLLNVLSVFMVITYMREVRQLEDNLALLNANVALLTKTTQDLRRDLSSTKYVEALVELQMRTIVLEYLKKYYPNLTLQDLEKLINATLSFS